jgi:drug/metabolite transporter (DMT)-like permease
MITYFLPMVIAIISCIFYHISQRSIVRDVNPMVSLAVTYLIALIFTLILLPILNHDQNSLISQIKKLNWATYALGITIVGIEAGFLLAYRAGWLVNKANLYSSVGISLALIPIGLYFFREKLSLVNAAGIVISMVGFVLMSLKPNS